MVRTLLLLGIVGAFLLLTAGGVAAAERCLSQMCPGLRSLATDGS